MSEMIETKHWYQSKSALGAIVAVVAMVAGFIGYQVTPEAQAQIVNMVFDAVALVGAVVALFGRITATKRIG